MILYIEGKSYITFVVTILIIYLLFILLNSLWCTFWNIFYIFVVDAPKLKLCFCFKMQSAFMELNQSFQIWNQMNLLEIFEYRCICVNSSGLLVIGSHFRGHMIGHVPDCCIMRHYIGGVEVVYILGRSCCLFISLVNIIRFFSSLDQSRAASFCFRCGQCG